jgi:DNA polymerase III delta subunit
MDSQPVYLVAGDLVLAEPEARQIAEARARAAGCTLEEHRRPARLGPLLDDLRTFSLFGTAKVMLVVDSAVLADRGAAAGLLDDAAEVVPLSAPGEGELSHRERRAASRLLQAFRLFDLDPLRGEPATLLKELPDWALEGAPAKGKRKRAKKAVAQLREDLLPLLEAAREAGLVGWAEDDAAALAALLTEGGMPDGHALILTERSVAKDHPLVVALKERKAFKAVGTVGATRDGGWEGLDLLAAQLRKETGVEIARDALGELAKRTLRQEGDWRSQEGAEADSTARFAGEYRKLASMARGGRIDRKLVADTVRDRGQEDVWGILDAIGAGRGDQALTRMRRLLASTDDTVGERLKFFGLLASFCRQLTAIRGMMGTARVPAGERSYPRFKNAIAPALQAELAAGVKNPLAGLHPYRLHRAYLAACRLGETTANHLPWHVLETEKMLKGDSRDAEAALSQLVARIAMG